MRRAPRLDRMIVGVVEGGGSSRRRIRGVARSLRRLGARVHLIGEPDTARIRPDVTPQVVGSRYYDALVALGSVRSAALAGLVQRYQDAGRLVVVAGRGQVPTGLSPVRTRWGSRWRVPRLLARSMRSSDASEAALDEAVRQSFPASDPVTRLTSLPTSHEVRNGTQSLEPPLGSD